MTTDSPYSPPQSALVSPGLTSDVDVTAHKRHVVYRDGIEWPSRCYKCNVDTDHIKQVKLVYVNPWIYTSLIITPILTIILSLIFQKKFKLNLPICDLHLKKRRNFLIFQWITFTLTILGFVVGVTINSEMLIVLSTFMILIVVITAIVGRIVNVAKYKNDKIWVSGTGRAFLNSLPRFSVAT